MVNAVTETLPKGRGAEWAGLFPREAGQTSRPRARDFGPALGGSAPKGGGGRLVRLALGGSFDLAGRCLT